MAQDEGRDETGAGRKMLNYLDPEGVDGGG